MKTIFRSLAVASVVVIAGSIYISQQVDSAKSSRYAFYGRDLDDTAEALLDDRIDHLHLIAKIPSVIYFGAAMAAFFVAARSTALSNGLRLTLRITSALCLGMLAWSFLLSARVSMDEVLPAWIIAPLLIGGLSFMLIRKDVPASVSASAPTAS